MKPITILKKDATILHDGIVAQTPEGRPVFIIPGNLPAPQLDQHPQGMLVYSVPEQEFPPLVLELLNSKERMSVPVAPSHEDRLESPYSELRTHALDLSADDPSDQKTG